MTHSLLSLTAGGWVLVLLAGLSCWMWTLILLKSAQFWQLRRGELTPEKCLGALQGARLPPGWQRQLLVTPAATLSELLERGDALSTQIARHVKTIIVLAQVAPLLGLSGTVLGMITTFDAITFFGTGNPAALASGISDALLTTQGGLLVAIPGIVVGTLMRRRCEGFRNRVEAFCIAVGRELGLEEAV